MRKREEKSSSSEGVVLPSVVTVCGYILWSVVTAAEKNGSKCHLPSLSQKTKATWMELPVCDCPKFSEIFGK